MKMTEYMLMKMEENEGLWTVGVDEGKTVIVTANGPVHGIQEEDGKILTAETLIQLFNEKKRFIKTES